MIFRLSSGLLILGLLAGCEPEAAAPPAGLSSSSACTIPANLDLATEPTPPDGIPDAPVTGHVLALSWSPEFCRFRGDAPEHASQCGDNRFGFILHGLWPQATTAPHPRACALAPPVTEELVREHFCMTPSAWLIQHEWSAHGTCAWDTAEGYFRDAAMLWQRFERPDLIGLSYDAELVPSDVRRAFARVNEGLPEQAVGIQINARGWLEEVFICLDLDYRPRPCAPAEYGPADSLQEGISIWRGGKTGN
ncbi:hypothetical protein B5C34_06100 [Pacificimonas flava]|uniref:Uncharacterized protein n=2 Tax=Pacificimonas TaxID=1960290 RepID=A0A219B3Y9_9SPHN|nr:MULTISPECIES: ribonuclease T [Pacificimonas]MBZ6377203.1 ribonuclease T [Pacificimonas aurantium]OWV33075.1 hypothetical protein B5C34_06100 [Pacificimonas flava]